MTDMTEGAAARVFSPHVEIDDIEAEILVGVEFIRSGFRIFSSIEPALHLESLGLDSEARESAALDEVRKLTTQFKRALELQKVGFERIENVLQRPVQTVGLGPVSFDLYNLIKDHNDTGGITLDELVKKTGRKEGTLRVDLHTLNKKGLVMASRLSHERNNRYFALTEEGQRRRRPPIFEKDSFL